MTPEETKAELFRLIDLVIEGASPVILDLRRKLVACEVCDEVKRIDAVAHLDATAAYLAPHLVAVRNLVTAMVVI